MARHLAAQRMRSMTLGNRCCYRSPNGLKCAVGCLIPDDRYNPIFDRGNSGGGYSALALLRDYPDVLLDECAQADSGLLSMAQSVHDNNPVEDWGPCLVKVAEAFELDDTAIIEAFNLEPTS